MQDIDWFTKTLTNQKGRGERRAEGVVGYVVGRKINSMVRDRTG
jgi:hypothetical protein